MEKPIWKAPAWRTGAPFSSASRTARSLTRSVSRSAIAPSTAARSCGGTRRHRPSACAALAAATAWSACSRPPLATLATSSSVAGLRISNRPSVSTQSPSMSME